MTVKVFMLYFYASATIAVKTCMFSGCLFVSECVRACPENCEHHISKTVKLTWNFRSYLISSQRVTDYIWGHMSSSLPNERWQNRLLRPDITKTFWHIFTFDSVAYKEAHTSTDYIWWSKGQSRMKYASTFTLFATSGGIDIDGFPSNFV